MTDRAYLYGIYEKDENLRYIGVTTLTTEERFAAHKYHAYTLKTENKLYNWMRSVHVEALQAKTIAVVDANRRYQIETQMIRSCIASGISLMNVAGTSELYSKISAALVGHEVTQETRNKISQANTGKRRTIEQKSLISEKRRGIVPPAESYKRRSASNRGKVRTQEHKQRMSQSAMLNRENRVRSGRKSQHVQRHVSFVETCEFCIADKKELK